MRFGEYLRVMLLGLAIALPVAIFFNWALRDYQPGYPDYTNQPNCEATKVAILSSDEAKRLVFLNVCDDEFSTKRLHNYVEQSPANNETNGHDTEVVNQAISAADLIEQRAMASSTYVIMWATALGLVVAAGGLVLISRTLSATRETLSVTQASLTYSETTARQAMKATEAAVRTAEAAESAERAYVYVELIPEFNEDKTEFFVTPTIKNYGRTPATSVSININGSERLAFGRPFIPIKNYPTDLYSRQINDRRIGPDSPIELSDYGPFDTTRHCKTLSFGDNLRLVCKFWTELEYTDTFGVVRSTEEIVSITPVGRFQSAIAGIETGDAGVISLVDRFEIDTNVLSSKTTKRKNN